MVLERAGKIAISSGEIDISLGGMMGDICKKKEMETLVMSKIDYKQYWEKGISWEQYLSNFSSEMEPGKDVLYGEYLPQNWSRQLRLHRKMKFTEGLLESVTTGKSQKWLVITEHWCGDASQILPIFQKLAEQSGGNIEVRYVYRDENPELIDAHLTDGRSRSIPIIIRLDEEYQTVKVYGPRPEEAQTLTQKILAEGKAYSIPLHSWYAKDRQVSLKNDLTQFVS